MIRLFALFACCLLHSSSSRGNKPDDAAAADLKALVGKWKLVKAEIGGKDSLALFKELKFEIAEGGKYTLELGVKDEGTFTVDPSKKPAEMEIKGTDGPTKGKTIKAIYKIDGDTVTICYGLGGGDRPTKFETKEGTKLFLAVYKREKK